MIRSKTFQVLTVTLLTTVAEGALVRGPYLQMATPNAMTVRWRTDSSGVGKIKYGTEVGILSNSLTEPSATTEHELRLTGLTPATTYFYAVEADAAPLAGGADYHFTTPPVVGTTGPFRFWALGDAGTSGYEGLPVNPQQLAVRDAFTAVHAVKPADFLMMLGDNAYGSGFDAEFQKGFFDIYPTFLRQMCMWSCLGNHETYSNPSAPPYFDMFTFPTGGECGGVASGTEHYYSFDYGNVHFISLDFMQSSRLATGAQAIWLQSDLQNVLAPWTVVFFHHPPYTHASHNSDFEGDLTQLREQMMPILENAGVDLVLSGHSHSYERSWLLRGHYGYSTSFNSAAHVVQQGDGREDGNGIYQKYVSGPNAGKGTVYVVAGSSGKISGGLLDHPAMYTSLNLLGSLVVDVQHQRLDVKFLTDTGSYADHFSMEKTANGPIVLPGQPLNLAVLATGTQTALLRWDDVAAESSYEVEMSGDGNTYNPVGTTGTNVNHLALTGLASGAQIWLRVIAKNLNGSTPSVVLTYTHAAPAQVPTPMAMWRFTHFADPTETGERANTADPDGDGSNNLLEYALDRNPRLANAPVTLSSYFDEEVGTYVLAFDRPARTDLTYYVETSTNLSANQWTIIFTSTGAQNTQEFLRVPDYGYDLGPRHFARLRVTQPQ